MPCHAMHPIQDLFWESFSYELQFDMHSYLHKNFILAKSGCYSGTARHGFDISRTSDQDLGPKESCHKVQDDQILQDLMEQPYGRRRNMGE
jgi:hypothetical protein